MILRVPESELAPAAVAAGKDAALGVDDEGAVVAAHDLSGHGERRGEERRGRIDVWRTQKMVFVASGRQFIQSFAELWPGNRDPLSYRVQSQ